MKLDWKSALGIAFSAVLLWWTLRGVALHDVWTVIRDSNLAMFGLCTVVATCVFPLRARRWRTILEPVAGVIAFGPLWRSTAIGVMMNNVFPLRAGEFGRALALTREVPAVPISTSLGSLAVDRIFDAIVVFALMFSAMLDPAFPPGVRFFGQTIPQLASGGIAVVAALMLVCYAVVLQPARVLAAVASVSRRVLPRFESQIVGFVEHGVGGLAVLKDSRRFLAVLAWAAAHWLVNALGMYLGFRAVGIDVPFAAALFLQGVIAISVAFPSSPGFVGVFEAAATLGLGVYGVPKDLALSWALGYHALTFVPITVMGAGYFARMGLSAAAVAAGKTATAGTQGQ